jgi:energy-coupling factor transporter transmembrane protein EcfT
VLFARADELALAMRDRCYSGAGGAVPPRPARLRDVLFALLAMALAIACALV